MIFTTIQEDTIKHAEKALEEAKQSGNVKRYIQIAKELQALKIQLHILQGSK